jgi:electron transfer flavoprotein beta subunit
MSALAVLVASRLDAVSGRSTRSRGDAAAVALALRQAATAQVRVVSAGAMSDEVARDYLALGAGRIELFDVDADTDAAHLVPLLASVVANSALVLTGTRAASGLGSGVLPYALAAALGRPMIADVVDLQPQGAAWIVTQAGPKGARRRLRVTVPAVLAICAAPSGALRHSYRDRMAGEVVRQPCPNGTAAPVSTATGTGTSTAWSFVPLARRHQVLEARARQSGHDRMLGAIDTQSASRGGTLIDAGNADDKARAILDYLRTHALVNF